MALTIIVEIPKTGPRPGDAGSAASGLLVEPLIRTTPEPQSPPDGGTTDGPTDLT